MISVPPHPARPRARDSVRLCAVVLALLALAACGKKGALYLPGEPPPPPSLSAPEG